MPPTPRAAWRLTLAAPLATATLLAGCQQLPLTGHAAVPAGTMAYTLGGPPQSPAIVLQSGLGDGRAAWADVWPALVRQHRVFVADRPGLGDSPATAAPRDPCRIADELHAALRSAQVPPPYLLVGHSLGGLYQFAFARLHPQDTAGLLLLDPTHPAHWATLQREAPAAAALVQGLRATVFSPAMRAEFDAQTACLDQLPPWPRQVPVRLVFAQRIGPPDSADVRRAVLLLRDDWQHLLGVVGETVPDSGHDLQHDAASRVVQTIDALAAQARRAGALR